MDLRTLGFSFRLWERTGLEWIGEVGGQNWLLSSAFPLEVQHSSKLEECTRSVRIKSCCIVSGLNVLCGHSKERLVVQDGAQKWEWEWKEMACGLLKQCATDVQFSQGLH